MSQGITIVKYASQSANSEPDAEEVRPVEYRIRAEALNESSQYRQVSVITEVFGVLEPKVEMFTFDVIYHLILWEGSLIIKFGCAYHTSEFRINGLDYQHGRQLMKFFLDL